MNQLKGFAPDLPSSTEGIALDCSQWIPYETGMQSAPTPVAYSAALAAECLGAATLTKLDGTRRVFAGTAAALFELSTTSWTDVTGTTPNLGAGVRWSFAQFGDTSIAASIDTTLQSTVTGDFADISGAPKVAIVESVLSSGGGFVLGFNTIDGSFGTLPDGWWCCGLNDVTNWTPSIAAQCARGRLLGFEGKITAAKKFGSDRIVAYKSGSIYAGTYVGPPGVWSWQEIPGYGCVGQDAIANLGSAHFVVGDDDIYIFDGVTPQPVSTGLRRWFMENSSGTYRYRTQVVYDRDYARVWIFFPGVGSSGTPDTCLVYHVKSGAWGRADRSIEAAFIFNTPSDTFDTGSGSFDSDTAPFDANSPGSKVLAIFNTSHILCTMDGVPASSSVTLFDMGDDTIVSRLTEARLRYVTKPVTASLSAFYSMATGGGINTGPTQSTFDVPSNGGNVFPLRQTARWHRLKFTFQGVCKVIGYQATMTPAGKR